MVTMLKRQRQEDESRRCSPCYLGDQRELCSAPELPKEIWCHIHSLLPERNAAQLACVAQDFLRSWRFRPNLTFNNQTLGINQYKCVDEQMRDFINIVDSVLKSHSGIGVKTLKFNLLIGDDRDYRHLDNWLQIIKPGIEEFVLRMSARLALYNFPMSILSGGIEASLQTLILSGCKFQPSARSGCFKKLTTLQLTEVYIEDDALSCLLASTPALERLDVNSCYKIICIKIPCLQQLSYLRVSLRSNVQLIESKAPNISRLYFEGELNAQLPLRTRQLKELSMVANNATFNACTELPFIMPNIETLIIRSYLEEVNTPAPPRSKFHNLKFLNVNVVCGRTYDFLSLVNFLQSCPSLETFSLKVHKGDTKWVSIFKDPSNLCTMPVYRHDKLKSVQIDTFMYAKKYIEFTCHILESATSLELLTLDTFYRGWRCSVSKTHKCSLMTKEKMKEVRKSALAVERYINRKLLQQWK